MKGYPQQNVYNTEKYIQKSGDGAMLFASPSPLDLGISGRGRKKMKD